MVPQYGQHGKIVCSCGKVLSQCRCFDHKNVTVVPNACAECKKK